MKNLILQKKVQINGRFDLVIKQDDEIEIIDFKSGSYDSNQHNKYDDQIKFYAYCFEQKYNLKPSKLSIIYLNDVTTINSDAEFNKFYTK